MRKIYAIGFNCFGFIFVASFLHAISLNAENLRSIWISKSKALKIRLHSTPLSPGTISGSQSVCATNNPLLFTSPSSASGGGGAITYTWQASTVSSSSGFNDIPSSNSLTYLAAPLNTTTWFRRACSTPVDTTVYSNVITVTVHPLPVPVASNSGPVCDGEKISFNASGGQYYLWEHDTLWQFLPSMTVSAKLAYAGVWTLTAASAMFCTSSVTMNVVIYPLPVPIVNSKTTVCKGDTLVLTGSGATSYTWDPGNVTGDSLVVSPGGSMAFTLTGTDQNGCKGSSMVFVTVEQPIPMWLVFSDTVVCAGDQATLSALNTSNVIWMPGNINSKSIVVTPASDITYTIYNHSQSDCIEDGTLSLKVNPGPTVTATVNRTTICLGESSTLTASGNGNISWILEDPHTGPTLTVSPLKTTNYLVKAVNIHGCEAMANVHIKVDPCTAVTTSTGDNYPVTLIPNPSQGAFRIVGQKEARVFIFNGAGAQVKIIDLLEIYHFSDSIEGLAPGIYILIDEERALVGKACVIH